jgi:uncharacterized membrane protein YgaE (UPF0421/DUF939 family)
MKKTYSLNEVKQIIKETEKEEKYIIDKVKNYLLLQDDSNNINLDMNYLFELQKELNQNQDNLKLFNYLKNNFEDKKVFETKKRLNKHLGFDIVKYKMTFENYAKNFKIKSDILKD